MHSYELLTPFNSEIVIACGSFITTGRQESKQSSHAQSRGGDTRPVFTFIFKKEQECALNTTFAVDAERSPQHVNAYALVCSDCFY